MASVLTDRLEHARTFTLKGFAQIQKSAPEHRAVLMHIIKWTGVLVFVISVEWDYPIPYGLKHRQMIENIFKYKIKH